MKTKFLEALRKYSMITEGDKVLVGLSGGADSMCLVSLFYELRDQLNISVSAVHINHCIRGEEADRDELFVREFCESKNIPLTVFRKDIPAIALATGESTELAARRIRYECFNECGADKIATAHSASDRVETFLFNLSRGASLKGLCSIPPVRDNIIRPLINITRSEIEDYCINNGISYITDSTNLTDEYTRNKYRLNVIPALCEINSSFEKNALRCIELLNEENSYIDRVSRKLLEQNLLPDGKLMISGLLDCEECIFRRVITAFFDYKGISEYESTHIGIIAENKGQRFAVCLPGNHRIVSDGVYIYFKDTGSLTSGEKLKEYTFLKSDGAEFLKGDTYFRIFVSECKPDNGELCVADADKVSEHLILRSRASGDCIRPGIGRCTKSLRKLFNELKIPEAERDYRYILADENGVAFVEGIGFDARCLCDKNTKKFLIIKTEAAEND